MLCVSVVVVVLVVAAHSAVVVVARSVVVAGVELWSLVRGCSHETVEAFPFALSADHT